MDFGEKKEIGSWGFSSLIEKITANQSFAYALS
jgi:hypothetical protein